MAHSMATTSEAFRNADNGSNALIGVSFALLGLTTVFFACFLLSRHYNKAGISTLMFWLIILGYIINAGNTIDNALSAILGDAGKHVATLSSSTNIASGKIGKAADYLYIPSAILPKLAMLEFYHRIFPGTVYRWTIYSCAGLLTLTLVAGLLQTTFICHPFAAYWTGDGRCGDIMESYRWMSWPNILTDFIMLVLPLKILGRLQIERGQRVKLLFTFVVGSLGIITAILRIVSFYTVPIFTDPTWYLIQPSIYSVLEPSAYLICTIIPTLRHLTRRVSNHISSTSDSAWRRGYTSYTTPTHSRLRTKLGKLNTNSSTSRKTVIEIEEDLELGRVGLSPKTRALAWNKTEVGTGTCEEMEGERAVMEEGGIVCKTDIDMFSETASSKGEAENEAWYDGEERVGSSVILERGTSFERVGGDEGFGDQVPLRPERVREGAG